MPVKPRIEIEGVRELNKLLTAVGGKELRRELGQVHKRIGQMVIDSAGGKNTGVGAGRGASIRASAATRQVQLRVGGTHRANPSVPRPSRSNNRYAIAQWGIRAVRPHPTRPHLIGAAERILPRIEREYLAGVEDVIRRAGGR